MTEQIVGPSVDELLPGQAQEIARLGMLVEAAGRLFGTLDLDAVLPDVLDLAQSTLAVDAYSLWRRDPTEHLVAPGVAPASPPSTSPRRPPRSQGNESVSRSTGRSSLNDIASIDVADARAQGGARCGGDARDARGAAAPPRRA